MLQSLGINPQTVNDSSAFVIDACGQCAPRSRMLLIAGRVSLRGDKLACVDTLALISAKLVATGRRDARPGAGKAAREAQLCPPGLPEALC